MEEITDSMYSKEDIRVLRDCAAQVKRCAEDPRNERLREMWREHTSLRGTRPPIFVWPDGSWVEILPEAALRCADRGARALEWELRHRIIRAEHIRDDVPIEPSVVFERWRIPIQADWGLKPKRVESGHSRGAWAYEPVVTCPADWKALTMPRLDRDDTVVRSRYDAAREAIGDMLAVELTGIKSFSFHMMHLYCDFRGLENMMMDLCEEPEMVHDVIAFFTEGYLSMLREADAAGLIALNNNAHHHYTGGLGYTRDLPPREYDPAHVHLSDVWGAAEAQEFALVSPEMHEEFILQYERRILENFGLNGYGCCDDLTRKLDNVKKIKNLRRVGISPWADIEKCADQLKKDYIMTWKPQPAYLSGEAYNESFVENYLTESLRRGKHGYMEIVLRDTHTCRGELQRFMQFVASARRAIDAVYGAEEDNFTPHSMA